MLTALKSKILRISTDDIEESKNIKSNFINNFFPEMTITNP